MRAEHGVVVPNTQFKDRLNQMDFRLTKTLKVARARLVKLGGQLDFERGRFTDGIASGTRLVP
jgi:hypothetical protein